MYFFPEYASKYSDLDELKAKIIKIKRRLLFLKQNMSCLSKDGEVIYDVLMALDNYVKSSIAPCLYPYYRKMLEEADTIAETFVENAWWDGDDSETRELTLNDTFKICSVDKELEIDRNTIGRPDAEIFSDNIYFSLKSQNVATGVWKVIEDNHIDIIKHNIRHLKRKIIKCISCKKDIEKYNNERVRLLMSLLKIQRTLFGRCYYEVMSNLDELIKCIVKDSLNKRYALSLLDRAVKSFDYYDRESFGKAALCSEIDIDNMYKVYAILRTNQLQYTFGFSYRYIKIEDLLDRIINGVYFNGEQKLSTLRILKALILLQDEDNWHLIADEQVDDVCHKMITFADDLAVKVKD